MARLTQRKTKRFVRATFLTLLWAGLLFSETPEPAFAPEDSIEIRNLSEINTQIVLTRDTLSPDTFMLRIGLSADTIVQVVEDDGWRYKLDSSLILIDSPEVQLHTGEIGTEPLDESRLSFKLFRDISGNPDAPYVLFDYQRGWKYTVPTGSHSIRVEYSHTKAWVRDIITDLRELVHDLPRVHWIGHIEAEYVLEVDNKSRMEIHTIRNSTK